MRWILRSLSAIGLIGILFWLGVLIHEAGHVASALWFGARLTRLNVLGLDLIPHLAPNLLSGYYGYMTYEGHLADKQHEIVRLSGSLATLGVALAAQAVLWIARPRPGVARLAVLTLCCFWLDVLVHTLPTLGIPAYLLFGVQTITPAAEAYLAAVALGMSARTFQALAVGSALALFGLTLIRWRRLRQLDSLYTNQTITGDVSTYAP